MRRPRFFSSGVSGWTTSSRWPSRSLLLTVDQTQPTTLPRYIALVQADIVHDAHDCRVYGSILAALGHAGGAAGDADHPLFVPGAYGIHSNYVTRLVVSLR